MANLAIRGHATRGKEVLQLLEMLGGINKYNLICDTDEWFVVNGTKIQRSDRLFAEIGFTLEEFLEKFPYKVGDKVTNEYRLPMIIFDMYWDSDFNVIKYNVRFLDDDKTVRTGLTAEDLQPYKEENMKEPKELIIGFTKDDNGNWVLNTHKDYEIKEIEGKYKVIKKKPQYPKDYDECYKIMKIHSSYECAYNQNLLNNINNFYKLLLCRDTYWKIAGEEMGLGKPWEPDWNDLSITYESIKINKGCFTYSSRVLVFPIEEMRYAFYENFKELINECKELL